MSNDHFSAVRDEIAAISCLDPEDVRGGASLLEYGLDSVRCMELVVAVEERFDVEVPDAAVAELRTVADVVALVAALEAAR